MAAEYEVNIKLNSKDIETQLDGIGKKISKLGKSKGGGQKSPLALPSTEMLVKKYKAVGKELKNLDGINRKIILSQSQINKQSRDQALNINTLTKIQDKKAKLVNKVNELEAKGLNVQKFRNQIGKISDQQSARRFASAEKEVRLLGKMLQLEQSKAKILRSERQNFPSSPIRGGANIAGSPLARLGGMKRLEQIGLGAGFPLLFGGGAGSILGGAAGGAVGSFGAQIAFSAIGQQVDAFIASTMETGKALTTTGGALDFMREKSLFSEEATARLAAELEGLGKIEELSELLTAELVQKIGNDGVNALQGLGQESNETTRLFNELTLQLQALIAGPLKNFLEIINSVLGPITTSSKFNMLERELTGQSRKEFDAEVARRKALNLAATAPGSKGASASSMMSGTGTQSGVGQLSNKDRQEINKAFLPRLQVTAKIPDLSGVKPPRKDAAAEKARREEERLQKRLAKLDQERLKVIEISRFKEKIALAEAAGDAQRVIRLQGEQRLAEIEQRRLDKLIGVTNQQEIQKINSLALAQTQAAQLETDRKLTEEQRKRQEFFDDTVQGLEHQLALATATTETEREQLRIEEKIRKLREGGKLSEPQLDAIRSRMNKLAEENNPLNQFKRQLEVLTDPVKQTIALANTLGDAFSESFRGLITGSMSAQQALANLFQRTADHFLDMTAQIIAAAIKAQAVQFIGSIFGSAASASASAGPSPLNLDGIQQYVNTSPVLTKLAEGGYVSRPTNALIGEGGEPEYVIPESKMRTAMSRYSRGNRGGSVIPESGATESMGEGGGTAVAAPIDVRYTVERINSIDYVTADQFQTGMQQAAQQGAKQGEQQTLKRLQMSGSTRKRIGI